jgi:hypothetical protein
MSHTAWKAWSKSFSSVGNRRSRPGGDRLPAGWTTGGDVIGASRHDHRATELDAVIAAIALREVGCRCSGTEDS